MIFALILLGLLVLDSITSNSMNFSYIFAKSCVVGLILFVSLMSSNVIDFGNVIMLSTFSIAVNFFVCLLVHLNIFVLYKISKLNRVSATITFSVGYVFVFMAIEYLKTL